jgi:signal peptide peptidase SppA
MSRHQALSLLTRINQQPLLIARGYENEFVVNAQELASLNPGSREEERAQQANARVELAAIYGYNNPVMDKPFTFVDGVAIIPIQGTLINRFSGSYGWITGYNFIRAQMNAAADDPDVDIIVYDINSGGGECAGCFELAEEMRALREVKPSLGVVDSNCFSAAYALGSACTKLVVTPSGSTGSIGVLSMHVDVSKALAQAGIDVTLIYAGSHKVDGNSFQALPASVREEIQASVDKRYGEFVALVAQNRGLDSQVVRDTEAQQYRADEALELNLIDAVQTPTDAVAAFLAEIGVTDPDQLCDEEEEDTMSKMTPEEQQAWLASPEGQAAVAAAAQSQVAAAQANGAAAAQARIKGILEHAEAKDRPALANYLAMDTDLSIEQAGATLAKAAKENVATEETPEQKAAREAREQQANQGNRFEHAMDHGQQPNIKPDADPNADKPSRAQLAMRNGGVGHKAASTSVIPRRAAVAK